MSDLLSSSDYKSSSEREDFVLGEEVSVLVAPKKYDLERSDDSREELSPYFTIAAAGFGMISDGYQNQLLTMCNVAWKTLYPAFYTSAVQTRVSNALVVGEIIGQICVGLICDRIGRKTALVGTTLMIIIGAIIGTAANGISGNLEGLFWCLTIARGITGFGAGGEYPASAASASEAANERFLSRRGPVIVLVTNFFLDFGGPLAVATFLIVLCAAGADHLNTVWRVSFGFGIFIPILVFVFRLRMINSKLYKKGAIRRRVPYWLTLRYYWKSLIGTCGSWFLFDFVFLPNTLFSGTIISGIIPDGNVKTTTEWQLLFVSLSLPGALIGAALCNPFGRRNTMMLGFGGYIVFGLCIGCAYDKIAKITPLFIIFYGLMRSFGDMGPGNMSILTSAESYATAVRGTCFGLSAAMGKVGAVVGTETFAPIQNNLGKNWTFIIAAIAGAAGIIITYLFVPEMTGVDFVDEDAKFIMYLAQNGWEGEVGDDNEKDFVRRHAKNRSCEEDIK